MGVVDASGKGKGDQYTNWFGLHGGKVKKDAQFFAKEVTCALRSVSYLEAIRSNGAE